MAAETAPQYDAYETEPEFSEKCVPRRLARGALVPPHPSRAAGCCAACRRLLHPYARLPPCPSSNPAARSLAPSPSLHRSRTVRFKPSRAKEVIAGVLRARLVGAVYHPDNTPQACKDLSDEIRNRLKAEPWSERYRYVVQVFLGEQKGEGIRLAARCLWDESMDNHASDVFSNESIICVASAYGVYKY